MLKEIINETLKKPILEKALEPIYRLTKNELKILQTSVFIEDNLELRKELSKKLGIDFSKLPLFLTKKTNIDSKYKNYYSEVVIIKDFSDLIKKYNKLYNQESELLKKLFLISGNGIGKGEASIALLSPDAKINGGSGNYDIDFHGEKIEVKEAKLDGNKLRNFRFGTNWNKVAEFFKRELKPLILSAYTDDVIGPKLIQTFGPLDEFLENRFNRGELSINKLIAILKDYKPKKLKYLYVLLRDDGAVIKDGVEICNIKALNCNSIFEQKPKTIEEILKETYKMISDIFNSQNEKLLVFIGQGTTNIGKAIYFEKLKPSDIAGIEAFTQNKIKIMLKYKEQ